MKTRGRWGLPWQQGEQALTLSRPHLTLSVLRPQILLSTLVLLAKTLICRIAYFQLLKMVFQLKWLEHVLNYDDFSLPAPRRQLHLSSTCGVNQSDLRQKEMSAGGTINGSCRRTKGKHRLILLPFFPFLTFHDNSKCDLVIQ